jgi:hypothetical protein
MLGHTNVGMNCDVLSVSTFILIKRYHMKIILFLQKSFFVIGLGALTCAIVTLHVISYIIAVKSLY